MRHPHINSRLGGFIAEQFSHMLESSYNWIQIVPPGCLGGLWALFSLCKFGLKGLEYSTYSALWVWKAPFRPQADKQE